MKAVVRGWKRSSAGKGAKEPPEKYVIFPFDLLNRGQVTTKYIYKHVEPLQNLFQCVSILANSIYIKSFGFKIIFCTQKRSFHWNVTNNPSLIWRYQISNKYQKSLSSSAQLHIVQTQRCHHLLVNSKHPKLFGIPLHWHKASQISGFFYISLPPHHGVGWLQHPDISQVDELCPKTEYPSLHLNVDVVFTGYKPYWPLSTGFLSKLTVPFDRLLSGQVTTEYKNCIKIS